ncbi:HEAT repeat domain-containing protein [bacterium BMS3Abin03]|jgi:HEAT repeat protein|nr:HEAT repeat domain-containing protein [bacterium BMS3Abin03]
MDNTMLNIEDEELKQLFETLGSDDGLKRKKARETLVAKGKETIDFLIELLSHPKHIYRWEAVKTLEEIGDPDTIPIFIQALEDDKSDVRWIAAEGLIKLGKKSIKPLLNVLIDKSDSVFVLEGAHHIFFDLREKGLLPAGFPTHKLLSALKNPEWIDSVKPLVYDILKNLK